MHCLSKKKGELEMETTMEKHTYHKKCTRCKTSFLTHEKEVEWCSDTCKEKFNVCTCRKCDKTFLSYQKRAYCSDECKKRFCSVCNRIYVPKGSESYCSEGCKIQKYTHTCKSCDQPFYKQTHSATYCSKECQGVYEKTKKYRKVCKNCKKLILVTSPNLFYCSELCIEEYRKKKERNQNANMEELEQLVRMKISELIDRRLDCLSYIGATVDFNEKEGFTYTLKEKVLRRDEYKCYICHDDKSLEIHHKLPQRLGGRHEENNLITLCKKCHRHIETGDKHHAFRKCMENVKKTYGMQSMVMKEKFSKKIQFSLIQEQLEQLSKQLGEKVDVELMESMVLIDNLIDEVEDFKKYS